jgi:chromosome segregation ATPase
LTASERLDATMQSIGGRVMVEQYETLIDYQAREKDIKQKVAALGDDLENLRKRNAEIEMDVRRFEDREQTMANIELIEKKMPYIRYDEAKNDALIVKQDWKDAQKLIDELMARENPAREEQMSLESELQTLEQQRNLLERGRKKQITECHKLADQIQKTEGHIDEFRKDLEDYHKESKNLQTKIGTAKRALKECESILSSERPEVPVKLNDLVTEQKIKTRKLHEDMIQVDTDLDSKKYSHQNTVTMIQEVQARIEELNNEFHAKLNHLRNTNFTAFQAYELAKEHKDKFDFPIQGPIMLDLNLRMTKYADALESCIPFKIMISFVALTQNDNDRFLRLCNEKNIRPNVIMLERDQHIRDYKHPIDREDLKSLGFECWLMDTVEAKDEIMIAVCEHAKLHQIPCTDPQVTVDDEDCLRQGLKRYISRNLDNRWKISKYGKKMATLRSVKLKKANLLASDNNDIEEKKESLNVECRKYIAEANKLKRDIGKLNEKRMKVVELQKAASSRRQELSEQKKHINDQITAYMKAELDKGISFES